MKKITTYLLAITTITASCSGCKKNSTLSSPLNVILFDKPLEIIQQNIQGTWNLVYYSGGYTGEIHYLNNYYVSFTNSRMSHINNNLVIIDTTIFWEKIKGTGINSDSTYAMNFYTNLPFPNTYIFDEIKNDTLIYHDYTSDPFYYHLMKL